MWAAVCRVMLVMLALASGPVTAAAATPPAASATGVVLLTLDGAVSPATADYVVRGIRRAAADSAGLVVLRMDTPGGLDKAMRSIIKEILASPVPVAVFVAPSGARAASAGTYLLYASHVAAMAPATNLGAATPVQIGVPGAPREEPGTGAKGKDKSDKAKAAPPRDASSEKAIQDAAAYIRGLAQLRGRNVDWAERAVREAVSLSAEEALKLKVVDLIAADVDDLLKRLDGRKVTVLGTERTLATAGAAVVELAPDWRSRLLAVIADPSVAIILLMIGFYGLIFEFMNPGMFVPGVAGGICLLLALFALQLLPVNYAGLGLILLGIAFIVAEVFLPSFGVLGIGGTAALVIGAIILIDTDVAPDYALSMPYVVGLGVVSSVLMFFVVTMALRARRQPLVSGREEMIGAQGVVLEDTQTEGRARVHGENWLIASRVPLTRGQRVRVTAMEGLTLQVEPDTSREEEGAS